MARIVVADDEKHARDRLVRLLKKLLPNAEIWQAEDGQEAIELIKKFDPDLIFLDLEMPILGGIDIAFALLGENRCIIFVTAYQKYAVRAFDACATDYIMKPIEEERLKIALKKAKMRTEHIPLELAEYAKFIFKSGRDQLIYAACEIGFFEGAGDYVELVGHDGSKHIIDETLDSLESRLPHSLFFRIHRSYIVNLHFVRKTEHIGERKERVVLLNQESLPVSRRKIDELRRKLQ